MAPDGRRARGPIGALVAPVQSFLSIEAASGILLVAATVVAIAWASSPWAAGYHDVFGWTLGGEIGPFDLRNSMTHWIDDGLMTVFFYVVGLEIKREWTSGELQDRRAAAVPAFAAVGGMVVPVLVYVVVLGGADGIRGWGIPMATDIAFAVTVLRLLGPRVPRGLEVFLLTLAIVDDVGAILVIALFYAGGISFAWLLGAGVAAAAFWRVGRIGAGRSPQVLMAGLALLVWLCTYESGVHATIAGVALALLTPRALAGSLEHRLHPWSAYLVLPVFALANAGVDLGGPGFDGITRVSAAVAIALVLGKAVGISLGALLAVRSGVGHLPDEVTGRQIGAVSLLGGIGFTVSLFVGVLAFGHGSHLEQAKAGILVGSLIAAGAGLALVAWATRPARADDP